MRITARAKAATRRRIVAAARRLFTRCGFAATSTRDLASAAGIATGTLFNYFPTKEALAMALVVEALERATAAFHGRRRGEASLEEDLFAHVAAGLRELEPYRGFLGEVLETAMSPFSRAAVTDRGEEVRIRHLETVAEILRGHVSRGRGAAEAQGIVSMHLYWTLYLGVLAFWTNDDSPHQEETLVVLDRSLQLFVASIVLPEGGADEGGVDEPDGSNE